MIDLLKALIAVVKKEWRRNEFLDLAQVPAAWR
jgi:hypothetical protein